MEEALKTKVNLEMEVGSTFEALISQMLEKVGTEKGGKHKKVEHQSALEEVFDVAI